MKSTEMVGRLVSQYPGVRVIPAVEHDALMIFAPGHNPVTISGMEMVQQTNDDAVIEILLGRLSRAKYKRG